MARKSDQRTVWIGETAPTPLGPVWAAASERGLWVTDYGIPREEFVYQVHRRGPARVVDDWEKVAAALSQMREFLEGERRIFDLRVDWSGMTPFQVQVRRAVMAIPYGQTVSYGEIAARVGKPQAARAVGRVQATNPLSLVIPCHRVIGADGSLHGFGGPGGLRIKAWLLELEGWTPPG